MPLRASEVYSVSEVIFDSEVSPKGEVMGKLNFTCALAQTSLHRNFTFAIAKTSPFSAPLHHQGFRFFYFINAPFGANLAQHYT